MAKEHDVIASSNTSLSIPKRRTYVVFLNNNSFENTASMVSFAAFGNILVEATSHLYLSALSFTPASSIIAATYAPQFPNIARVTSGNQLTWPVNQGIIQYERSFRAVAFSRDGRYIATGDRSESGFLRIWDAYSQIQLCKVPQGHVVCLNFSVDGKYLAIGYVTGSIGFLDMKTFQLALAPSLGRKLEYLECLEISPDGTDSGEPISDPLRGHTGKAVCLAFSPDGLYIASGSRDNTVRICSSNAPQGGSASFGIVAISPDSEIIATDGDDSTILLWDAEKCIQISKPLEGHTSFIFCLSFSFDGKRLVSGSHDKTLRLWDVETGDCIGDPLKGHLGAVNSAVFSSDGRYLASGFHGCSIYLWDTMSGSHISKPLEVHTDSVSCLSFSEDDKELVSGSFDGSICIWDVLNWAMIGKMARTTKGHVYSVAFSRDSLSIVSSGRPELLQVWDAATGTLTPEPNLTASKAPVLAEDATFTTDGSYSASSYHDGSVQLWNIKQTPSMIHLKGHLSHIPSLAFAPNNKYLVTASEDATVRI
ncbi:hypothetical protein M422DRAFT_265138 [Sphaerobolus stellatus SS14]|uniref:WD40 repeat-like protein n=1 Tax=Sphaerobolus stellatus (strain SS14) TaxID=990650 RepID=A0A0C9V6K3_SPHS4|nr:hypothetical protein M422DRAFT_265138 [Sphaerobolus stellatus SS14]